MIKPSFKRSVTSRILAMKFAAEFMLIYPLYTIMFGERGGVTAAGIGFLLALDFILTVAFEIPTGIVADKIPRKYVLLMSIFAKMSGMFMWLIMPNFTGYALGTAIIALSSALESGALQAYLYGTLGKENQKSFGKFWARVHAMVMLSYTIAYVAAFAVGVRYEVLLGACLTSLLVATGFCLSLPKDRLSLADVEVKPKIFKSAISHILHSPELKGLLVGAIFIVGLAELVIMYHSLYAYQIGVPARYVTLVMATGNIIGALLFWTLHSYEGFLNKHKILLAVLANAVFILSFRGSTIVLVIGLLTVVRLARVLQVQFESNIQHLANDEARATVSSIASFASKLITGTLMIVVGLMAVDNVIVRPLRIVIISLTAVFMIMHYITKLSQKRAPQ